MTHGEKNLIILLPCAFRQNLDKRQYLSYSDHFLLSADFQNVKKNPSDFINVRNQLTFENVNM